MSNSNQENYSLYIIKLLLIGNRGVGKSSLLNKYVNNSWNENFVSNIGIDFVRIFYNLIFIENKDIRFRK